MATKANIPDESEIVGYMTSLNNWGRWGDDDEFGTINFIGPEERKHAASLVKEGISVSCSRPITKTIYADTVSQVVHYMTGSGEGYSIQENPQLPENQQGSGDFIGMAYHGYNITHIDSLSHIFWNGQMYNGKPSSLVTTREGAKREAIEVLHDGVISRGVLLDAARFKGVDWMEPGEYVTPDELEEISRQQGVTVGKGDILLVRTGHHKRRMEAGTRPVSDGWPGLHASCLPWIHEKQVAVIGGDTVSDVVPSGYPNIKQPIHQVAIPHMGLWLLDNLNLEEIANACLERKRWEFMFTVAPLRVQGGTGSPINPIAMF